MQRHRLASLKYTHAVVCRIPSTFKTEVEGFNLEEAKKEHEIYVQTLRDLGLDVIELPPDEENPLCTYVEDLAVMCNGSALICKIDDPSRNDDILSMRSIIKKELELPVSEITEENARLIGRDVLFTGKEFFVGLSKKTNEGGARAVAAAFPEYPCTPIKVDENSCLKALVSIAGPDILCVSTGKESQEVLKRISREATFSYKTLTVPEDIAVNVMFINGTLIHRSEEEIPLSNQVKSFLQYLLKFKEDKTQEFISSLRALLLKKAYYSVAELLEDQS